ncbi:MAG: gelD [Phenylobacterium sp.]|nr:gelD [Phenylobacterium sp.]
MRLANFCMAVMALVAAGAAGAASAQAQPAPAPAGPSAPGTPIIQGAAEGTSGAYILGRDDVVEVSLLGRGDYGGRARVQADGTIQLPLIGKIVATETSTSELADKIRKALQSGGYYADPIVSVEVASYASRYVTVLGAVGSVGLIPINRPYRLSEILAKVGGVNANAADYLIVRPEHGEQKRYTIRDLATGDSSKDPYVAAGDKIYAPVADIFYITGQVNGPGAFTLVSDMTVRMAIAKGGGLTESGNDKNVEVTRGGKKMKLRPDDQLQAGDVLLVKERLF